MARRCRLVVARPPYGRSGAGFGDRNGRAHIRDCRSVQILHFQRNDRSLIFLGCFLEQAHKGDR